MEEIPDLNKYLGKIETAELVSKTVPETKCKIEIMGRKIYDFGGEE